MFTTVRRYEGVSDPQAATKRVQEGFVPLISQLPGFVEYLWVDVGQGAMLSISVFDTLPNAIEANQTAVSWVRSNLGSLLPQNPRIESGKIVAHKSMSKASLRY